MADVVAVGITAVTAIKDRRGLRSRGFHRNVRVVLRAETGAQRPKRLLWRWARHMAHMVVDVCRLPKITPATVERLVDVSDLEQIRPILDRGVPIIAATGHIGIPDLTAYVAAVLGHKVSAIYAPTPVKPVTRAITKLRETSGQTVIDKAGALKQARRVLQRGEVLGIACDVSARQNSIFVPFLGVMAATNAAVASLHRASDAVIVVCTCNRVSRGRYRFHIWDAIEPEPKSDKDADLLRVMTRVNAALGKAILAYPEQWWWHGRRFRRRPTNENELPSGLPPLVADASPRF